MFVNDQVNDANDCQLKNRHLTRDDSVCGNTELIKLFINVIRLCVESLPFYITISTNFKVQFKYVISERRKYWLGGNELSTFYKDTFPIKLYKLALNRIMGNRYPVKTANGYTRDQNLTQLPALHVNISAFSGIHNFTWPLRMAPRQTPKISSIIWARHFMEIIIFVQRHPFLEFRARFEVTWALFLVF